MPNPLHLLLERQTDSLGRIMQRLMTGYAKKVGKLVPGLQNCVSPLTVPVTRRGRERLMEAATMTKRQTSGRAPPQSGWPRIQGHST